MSAPSTPEDITNLALQQLYQAAITSLQDPNDDAAGKALIAYDQVRRSLERNFDWNFTRTRAFAPLLPNVVPAFDYQYTYQLPTNLIRLLFIGRDYERFNRRRHEIQGRTLLTNLQPCNEYAGTGYNLGQITLPISNVTQASPGVVTVPNTNGLVNGQSIIISGVNGMVELNANNGGGGPGAFTALNPGATFFTLGDIYAVPLSTSGYHQYVSGGNVQSVGPVEGGYGTPRPSIPIIYSQDVTDVTQMDPLFIDCFVLQLAAALCMPITGDQSLLARLEGKLKSQLAEAVAINHQERPVVVTEKDPIQQARWAEGEISYGYWGTEYGGGGWGEY